MRLLLSLLLLFPATMRKLEDHAQMNRRQALIAAPETEVLRCKVMLRLDCGLVPGPKIRAAGGGRLVLSPYHTTHEAVLCGALLLDHAGGLIQEFRFGHQPILVAGEVIEITLQVTP